MTWRPFHSRNNHRWRQHRSGWHHRVRSSTHWYPSRTDFRWSPLGSRTYNYFQSRRKCRHFRTAPHRMASGRCHMAPLLKNVSELSWNRSNALTVTGDILQTMQSNNEQTVHCELIGGSSLKLTECVSWSNAGLCIITCILIVWVWAWVWVSARAWARACMCLCVSMMIIKGKHFSRNWPFVLGIHRSLVNSPHKGQWRGCLTFSLICA